jgi:hypothetical protein
MLAILQRIEPRLREIRITGKEAPGAYLELMKVFKNHARASDYTITNMKHHIGIDGDKCDCKAFHLGFFKPLHMPKGTYEKVNNVLSPLPSPEERSMGGDMRYMSLEDTMVLPFTDHHRPSQIFRATFKNQDFEV